LAANEDMNRAIWLLGLADRKTEFDAITRGRDCV